MDNTASLEIFSSTIDRLRQLSQQSTITAWRYCAQDLAAPVALAASLELWSAGEVTYKNYLTWPAGQVQWLGQVLVVPKQLQGYPTQGHMLRLALTWWAIDVQIYVNGQLVQAGDLFDARVRVLLSPAVQPGDTWDIRIRLVSPGHDQGALMQSVALYESIDNTNPEPGFFADELAVVDRYQPAHLDLNKILVALDWQLLATDVSAFQAQLQSLRQQVINQFPKPTSQLYLLSHAHLDMAWLWEVTETWEVAERTFQSVLSLQATHPQLTFCHTSPALYAWLQDHRPALFAQIQAQVAAGRWEVLGGMWIEPDMNLISGESIARQIIYGQQYVQAQFGSISRVAWLPDTFGFCQQLPQFLKLGQIDYFVTQKFLWNDTNPFPHQLFWWESPDGTKVLSYMSAPIGEGIDPVKMATYATQWTANTGNTDALWIFGVGDHGGGPSRDMLAIQERWEQSPLFPKQTFTTVEKYLASQDQTQLPVWSNELYLEFHRGCYTNHADQKLANRQAEELLYQAELWSTIANFLQDDCQPLPELDKAWQKTLFNQFHDILPGSSIAAVYATANEQWHRIQQITTQAINQSLDTICQQLNFPPSPLPDALPIVIFNSLGWTRTTVVRWPIAAWQVYDDHGQLFASEQTYRHLVFVADNLPSVGYQLFWLVPTESKVLAAHPNHWCLENQQVRVEIDPQTGDIASMVDKDRQLSILAKPGNQLQAFADSGQYWDAWNIDPLYTNHPLPAAQLQSIAWLHSGTIEQRLRVVRRIGQSTFTQDYVLAAHSPELSIETTVDWQEEHVLVKAFFPLSFRAETVTCEVPCGVMVRPTTPTTPQEAAKWEIPAYRWVDLTSPELDYGVSLLNDCKYGYSFQPDSLSLTLLRSSTWPDPQADRGTHQFTYVLYPHAHSWVEAGTVQLGCELNSPLHMVIASNQTGALPTTHSFIELESNLVLMALKPALNHPSQLILRCYEATGQVSTQPLQNSLGLKIDHAVDLLETPLPASENSATVQPWQIRSWLLAKISKTIPS